MYIFILYMCPVHLPNFFLLTFRRRRNSPL